jgi:hypothetical protein
MMIIVKMVQGAGLEEVKMQMGELVVMYRNRRWSPELFGTT